MKSKLLLPAIALMGSSLLVGSVRAKDQSSTLSSTSLDQTTINASQLLHSKVLDQSGHKIGDIEDVILDQPSSKAPFAVIKLSGDLADHGKYTPVPLSLLRFKDPAQKDSFGHRDLVFQADREKLMAASRFNVQSWPDSNHPAWGQDVYSYYGVNWPAANTGATGSSFSSGSGTQSSSTTVQETYPSHTAYYQYNQHSTDWEKPIDNGTGPDGRDTFRFHPRPWPYSEMGASGTTYVVSSGSGASRAAETTQTTETTRTTETTTPSTSTSSSDPNSVRVGNSQVIVKQRHSGSSEVAPGSSSTRYESQSYAPSTPSAATSTSDRYYTGSSTTYQTRTYVRDNDKPIDNGTAPDGRDTFHFTPRPWPYHDTIDAH
jgi:sporulation protein YlmC with PRC-barrel domain